VFAKKPQKTSGKTEQTADEKTLRQRFVWWWYGGRPPIQTYKMPHGQRKTIFGKPNRPWYMVGCIVMMILPLSYNVYMIMNRGKTVDYLALTRELKKGEQIQPGDIMVVGVNPRLKGFKSFPAKYKDSIVGSFAQQTLQPNTILQKGQVGLPPKISDAQAIAAFPLLKGKIPLNIKAGSRIAVATSSGIFEAEIIDITPSQTNANEKTFTILTADVNATYIALHQGQISIEVLAENAEVLPPLNPQTSTQTTTTVASKSTTTTQVKPSAPQTTSDNRQSPTFPKAPPTTVPTTTVPTTTGPTTTIIGSTTTVG
jgi:hypothetical protein